MLVLIASALMTEQHDSGSTARFSDNTDLLTGTLVLSGLLAHAIASCGNGITIADAMQPDLPLIFINPAFEKTTGYLAREVIGRNCRFLHGEDRDQPGLEQVRAAIAQGGECRVVLRNYRKDGALFWNEFYISPVRDAGGRVTHFIGVQNDISEQVRLMEARDQFFQIASHDLKNPLTSIIGAAAIAGDYSNVGEPITAELQQIMRGILSRGRQMQRIIEDYLDFQAMEDGSIAVNREPVDLAGLARESVRRNRDDAERKRIALHGPSEHESATAIGDAEKILQVAQNLVGNAIKFSAPGTQVRVTRRTSHSK
jgi:PAS domain S-box-containing protein